MTRSTRVPLPLLVRGSIRFPAGAAAFSRGQARVQLLDVTMLDVPSTVIVEQIISNVSPGEPVEFELRAEVPPANGSYSVSAHIKPNPDPTSEKYDDIEPGDYLTVQSYPVRPSADKTIEVVVDVCRYAGPAEKY
jgi:hypothetical protein